MFKTLHRKAALFGLALIGFALSTFPAQAANNCPGTISGDFDLTEDLTFDQTTGSCIRVSELDDVTIRLNGHSITGVFGNVDFSIPATGIVLLDSSNVTIEGPGTIEQLGRGIGIFRSDIVDIEGVEIDENNRGIQIGTSSDITVKNTKITNSANRLGSNQGGQGVFVFGPSVSQELRLHNILLDGVEVEQNRIGILFSNHPSISGDDGTQFRVERCKVRFNQSGGISVLSGTNVTVRLCEITDNGSRGMFIAELAVDEPIRGQVSGVKISESVIANHFATGIQIGSFQFGEYTTLRDDVQIRKTCFENNGFFKDWNNVTELSANPISVIEHKNEVDPIDGCELPHP